MDKVTLNLLSCFYENLSLTFDQIDDITGRAREKDTYNPHAIILINKGFITRDYLDDPPCSDEWGNMSMADHFTITLLGQAYFEKHLSETEHEKLLASSAVKDHRLAILGAITGIIGGATGLIALLMQLFQNTPPPAP